jgi:hypothetical protein
VMAGVAASSTAQLTQGSGRGVLLVACTLKVRSDGWPQTAFTTEPEPGLLQTRAILDLLSAYYPMV